LLKNPGYGKPFLAYITVQNMLARTFSQANLGKMDLRAVV
jgi:hypothetical protein